MKKAKSVKRKSKKAKVTAAPEACETCHNWRETLCKRYPPEWTLGQEQANHRIVTHKNDWCGEWRAR